MTITILLVDDSDMIRFLFGKALDRDPDLRVIGTAADGREAIDQARILKPDMVLLDIDMPVMDGITALPKIRAASRESKVFMITAGTADNANAAFNALGLGAAEFILKPGIDNVITPAAFIDELRTKIKAIWSEKVKPITEEAPILPRALSSSMALKAKEASAPMPVLAPVTALAHTRPLLQPEKPVEFTLQPRRKNTVLALAIAASTGGPEALLSILTGLRGELLHIPIFITQHMPEKFTGPFAKLMAEQTKRLCKEAVDGEIVEAGMIYIAPGNQHLLIKKQGNDAVIHLSEAPHVNSCRPSADPMFASISEVYGPGTLGLVLTGIGQDGTDGSRAVFDAGGAVLAQDQESSTVFGMPKAAALSGVCEAILPLPEIANHLLDRCRHGKAH